MNLKRRLFWFAVFGISFGYIESAVVVYLREIYYPDGFSFPLAPIAEDILRTETLREAATLALLWSAAALSYVRLQSRIAAFFILFGIWDIFYYVFLKLLLDWPASMQTWDILFLIPLPWVGPVWAPVAVSLGLIILSTALLIENEKGRYATYSPVSLLCGAAGAGLIIASFILPALPVLKAQAPGTFPILLFLSGYILGVFAYLYALKSARSSAHSLHKNGVA